MSILKFAVIGRPIAHSLSPLIHNAGYHALDIHHHFHFSALEASEEELRDILSQRYQSEYAGLAVTYPYKQRVIQYLDEISSEAKRLGAVNTVLLSEGRRVGSNTDWEGVLRPMSAFFPRAKQGQPRLAVLGAGGAAAAALYAGSLLEMECHVFSRNENLAGELCKTFAAIPHGLSELEMLLDCDCIFQGTPVGMGEAVNQSLVPIEYLKKEHLVFESIYYPRRTRLVVDAESTGATVILGEEMLLQQAFSQFKLFTGRDPDEASMRQALQVEMMNRESGETNAH